MTLYLHLRLGRRLTHSGFMFIASFGCLSWTALLWIGELRAIVIIYHAMLDSLAMIFVCCFRLSKLLASYHGSSGEACSWWNI